MKLRYNFEIAEVSGEIVAVAVGENAEQFSGILKINQTGKEIIECLKKEYTVEQIINYMNDKYETSDAIEKSIKEFIDKLIENNIVIK